VLDQPKTTHTQGPYSVKEPSVLGLVGNAPTALSMESDLRSGAAASPGATGGAEPIRVLVVDDHVLFRRGLDMVLGQEPDIALVGEAGDGAEALAKAADLLPDIVLLDVRMPRRSGIEACAAIKEVVPTTRIIMLTISDDEADLYDAVKAGASGYLLKEISIDEVSAAIRAVAGGQSLISPAMASKLLSEFASMIKKSDDSRQIPAPRLTDRELDVLKLVARGMNNREIGAKLFISENTVKNHIRNILEKLQLHSRMEAVMYAVREKILDIPAAASPPSAAYHHR
jgi:DNA-binding NarL/FixJ family response regulator